VAFLVCRGHRRGTLASDSVARSPVFEGGLDGVGCHKREYE
jgi:hypothetical protein